MGNLNQTWVGVSYTDTGMVRSLNEDSVLEKNSEQFWAVADGMGGHSAGDYASQHLVNQLLNFTTTKLTSQSLASHDNAVQISNAHLVNKAMEDDSGIIGCTLASLFIDKHWAICSWSGDSRIYRLRNGELKLLTQDHSQMCDYDDRNLLTSLNIPKTDSQVLSAAIGGMPTPYVERAWYTTEDDDRYLLCTDGMYKEASDAEIAQLLSDAKNADDALRKLAAIYHERGARDNVGLVYVSQ